MDPLISRGAVLPGALANTVLSSPFLDYVSDTESFDNQLSSYIKTTYVREK